MRFPVILMAGLALAGCASSHRPADVRLPAAYEGPASAPAGTIGLDRWWDAFGDAELTGLVEDALARNTDVRTARARLAEVRAQRQGTIFQYVLPSGDLTASGRRTTTEQIGGTVVNIPGFSTSGTSEQYNANFNVSWEIDPLRAAVGIDVAGDEVDRARFAYESTRASIAAQTADTWFQARGLAIQLADARETARIRREIYDIASKRVAIGVAAASDADRVASDLAQAESQVTAFEAELQVQKRAILILAGRVVEPTAAISAPPAVGAPPPVPAAIPSELLERRPDVRQAQSALRSAIGQQKLAGLAFFPTFTLTPGLGWTRIEQPGFSSETANWTIGGSVLQPVLSVPRLLAELRAQSARTEQAVAFYEKTVQTAFQEAEGALVSLDADRRRVSLLTEGEARGRRAYEAARIGYERGFNDLNTVLTAEQEWRLIRAQMAAAQVQALRRTVQAYKALGGGWPAQAYAQAR